MAWRRRGRARSRVRRQAPGRGRLGPSAPRRAAAQRQRAAPRREQCQCLRPLAGSSSTGQTRQGRCQGHTPQHQAAARAAPRNSTKPARSRAAGEPHAMSTHQEVTSSSSSQLGAMVLAALEPKRGKKRLRRKQTANNNNNNNNNMNNNNNNNSTQHKCRTTTEPPPNPSPWIGMTEGSSRNIYLVMYMYIYIYI